MFGKLLGKYWEIIGKLLGHYWEIIGKLLGNYSEFMRKLLGKYWEIIGTLFVNYWELIWTLLGNNWEIIRELLGFFFHGRRVQAYQLPWVRIKSLPKENDAPGAPITPPCRRSTHRDCTTFRMRATPAQQE